MDEDTKEWRPLRPAFCKLLDFPEHYSWEAIYEEVKLIKRRLSQLSDVPTGPPEGIAKQNPSSENLEKKNEDPRVVRVYNGCSPTPIAWWTESGGTKE